MKIHPITIMAGNLLIAMATRTIIAQKISTSRVHVNRQQGHSMVRSLGMSRLTERPSGLTVRTLDTKGRVVKVVEPDAQGRPAFTTEITYGDAGKVTSIKQSGGRGDSERLRTFVYDTQGRVISATSPEAGETTYTYDSAGNLSTKTDSRSNTVTYSWDDKKRLTAKQYTDGTATHIFTYSSVTPNYSTYLDTSSGHESEREYHYNSSGQLQQLIVHVPGKPEEGYSVGLGYDGDGRVGSITYPDGRVVSQTWTKAGKLTSLSSEGLVLFSQPTYFNGSGHLKSATLGNGVIIHDDLDAQSRIGEVTLKRNNSTVLHQSFE